MKLRQVHVSSHEKTLEMICWLRQRSVTILNISNSNEFVNTELLSDRDVSRTRSLPKMARGIISGGPKKDDWRTTQQMRGICNAQSRASGGALASAASFFEQVEPLHLAQPPEDVRWLSLRPLEG